MAYEIILSEDKKYILLKVWGEMNSVIAMEQNLEVHALCRQLGITRILVDATEARNVDTVTRTYQFAYNEMKTPPEIMLEARVATLVSPDDHSHDFVETVSRNAGMDVTLFRDREAAIKHLLEGA